MDLCNLRCQRKEKQPFLFFLVFFTFLTLKICSHLLSCWKDTLFCLESELRARFRWFLLQLDSSSKFSRFLASPDNRADCCPCTDCQVERGATLSRRFSARRPHPAPASPPPAPRPRANPFISSFQFTNPPLPPSISGHLQTQALCFLVTYEPAGNLINLLHLARRARPATAFRAQQLT